MSATDQDVRALEHLAHRLREDTTGCGKWDAHGTHVVFARELKGMTLAIAMELVVAHATDPDAKTPAAITRPFKPEVTVTIPPPEMCRDHPDEVAPPVCRIHKQANVRAERDPIDAPPLDKETALALAREKARAAAGRLTFPTDERNDHA